MRENKFPGSRLLNSNQYQVREGSGSFSQILSILNFHYYGQLQGCLVLRNLSSIYSLYIYSYCMIRSLYSGKCFSISIEKIVPSSFSTPIFFKYCLKVCFLKCSKSILNVFTKFRKRIKTCSIGLGRIWYFLPDAGYPVPAGSGRICRISGRIIRQNLKSGRII